MREPGQAAQGRPPQWGRRESLVFWSCFVVFTVVAASSANSDNNSFSDLLSHISRGNCIHGVAISQKEGDRAILVRPKSDRYLGVFGTVGGLAMIIGTW